jgi:hypothetical protein
MDYITLCRKIKIKLYAHELMAGNNNETASRFGSFTQVEISVTNSSTF